MVITTRDDIADRVSKQRAFGIDRSVLADRRHTGAYDIELPGLNYRLGEVGAAMGVEQMRRLPDFLKARAAQLRPPLRGPGRDRGARAAATRTTTAPLHASHYCLVGMLREPLAGRREELIEALKAEGIGTSVYYPKSLPDTSLLRAASTGTHRARSPRPTRISTARSRFPCGPHVTDEPTSIGSSTR